MKKVHQLPGYYAERDCETSGHCWHCDGTLRTSDPPWYGEDCCWCGAHRDVRDKPAEFQFHGPHLPYWRVFTAVNTNDEVENA